MEIEAEFAHAFIRRGGWFAYTPIIASGKNACVLHYIANDQVCKKGDLLLLDVASNYANYNSDLTRTIPVNGKFTRRQKQVYNAVLKVMRGCIQAAVPGKLPKQWQKEAEAMIQEELLVLRLLKPADSRKQDPNKPALKKYIMHGIGHPLGLDRARRRDHHGTLPGGLGVDGRTRNLHSRRRDGGQTREQYCPTPWGQR